MSEAKTVIILGGGVGGVVAANRLRQHLRGPHRVVLIDRERQHLFQPSLLATAGTRGVVFGDIHHADVRAWFEDRVRAPALSTSSRYGASRRRAVE